MSGGSGSRMNSDIPKQLLKIGDRTLLEISISKFQDHSLIDEIFIVSHIDLINTTKELVDKKKFSKVKKIIAGGDTRQASSAIGVNASSEIIENILIHDSARPFLSKAIIDRVLNSLISAKAVTPVIDSSDTLISMDSNGLLEQYLDRNSIKRVQTPQGFRRDTIIEAHKRAGKNPEKIFTDDCSMIINFNISNVHLVEGDPENIKITYKEDLKYLNLNVGSI